MFCNGFSKGASLYETEYSDTDPNQYHQFGVPNYGTSAGHSIRDWETRSRRVETTEEQFTLSYGPRSETRTGQSSVTSRFESVTSETRSEQSIDPTYGDGPFTEGERTIVHHLDKIFPFEGPPTGWEHHYEFGWQSNVDGYPSIGDIWHDRDPGTFTYEHVAPHDPLAEEELEDRAPVENTTPGGGGAGSFILAPFRALATLLKPLAYAAASQVTNNNHTRAFNQIRDLETNPFQRGEEFAGDFKPFLEDTSEILLSATPIIGPLADQAQLATGFNVAQNRPLTQRETNWTVVGLFSGTIAAALEANGRILSRIFSKADDGGEFGGKAGKFAQPKAASVQAGEAGRFADLDRRAKVGDDLTPHHMPQAARGFTSHADGGAIVVPKAVHKQTRTYLNAGRQTALQEATLAFRDTLARDIRDLRSIVGNTYNQGIKSLLDYYRSNFPGLINK